jgi:hypothetical protein
MKIQERDLTAEVEALGHGAETRINPGYAGPTAGNAPFATWASDAGARALERHRAARAMERRLARESVLLGGIAVAFALLSAMAFSVAESFGARFVG